MKAPLLATALGLAAAGCGGAGASEPTPPTPRSFALGFTDFPSARSVEAVADALRVIERDGDLVVLHFDDGVPWEEALAGTPYPAAFQQDLERRAAAVPPRHVRYLAVTPIAFERDRLAPRRGGNGSEPLLPPWEGRGFDHPEVVAAFAAHCERMIATFSPHYFAYAIEANMLARLAPRHWPGFLRLASAVYGHVKARHPTLPVFLSLQADFFHADPGLQTEWTRQALAFSDFVAVSSYPFTVQADPRALRADLFSALTALAPDKPFAVAETGWPAEDVAAPHAALIPASDETQRLYVERLLADAERLAAAFVTWFFTRDYDTFWEAELRLLPQAPLLRLWKDCGLYAGDGRPRPGLTAWLQALVRARS